MTITSVVAVTKKAAFLLLVGILSILHQNVYDSTGPSLLFSHAKEIETTKEWQKIEGDDTIPAGAHVKMDMTTGEKWVKMMSDDDEDDDENNKEFRDVRIQRNADGSGKDSVSIVVVEADGEITTDEIQDEAKSFGNSTNYNFEMMYRTLSKLPPDEIEKMGGLPEIPETKDGHLRSAFEERMLEIWTTRQAELLEAELNFPEILKARIAGIKEYIADPENQLESIDLDADEDEGTVTDIISLLKDLEFQLSDIDMARDFHTMEGWPLLVQLVAQETHLPANKTLEEVSKSTKAKIRAIQAHAAWAIGTAVKNTEEFFPYAVERVHIGKRKVTTAIDLLIDVFCEKYDDSGSWEVRTLLARGIYGIGAILRGNSLAQTHVAKSHGFDRLGRKLKDLSREDFNSANTKLIQRLVGLSSDLVEDFSIQIELSEEEDDAEIIQSLSSHFCEATCELFLTEKFIPMKVQETLVKAISVLGPHCKSSNCGISEFRTIVEKIQSDWVKNKDDLDHEHFGELQDTATGALEALTG